MKFRLLSPPAPFRSVGCLLAALSLHLGLLLALSPSDPPLTPSRTSSLVDVQFEPVVEQPQSPAPPPVKPRSDAPVERKRSSFAHPRPPISPDRTRGKDTSAEEAPHLLAASNGAAVATTEGLEESGGDAQKSSGTPSTAAGIRSSSHGTGSSLQQGARLLARSMQCADLYPYQADVDRALVAAEVVVSPNGHSRLKRILKSSAPEPGFSAAARLCAQRLLFAPARDGSGHATSATAIVRMTFERT